MFNDKENTATGKIFRECIAEVPSEMKLEICWSDAIAKRISDYLSEYSMSKKEFADQLGVTEEEISCWLSGTHNFTLRTLSKIAVVFVGKGEIVDDSCCHKSCPYKLIP